MRQSLKGYLQLFWSFFKIGGFTFGGGWAMITLIEREIVDHRRWMERGEFLDLLAISQSLPGVLAVNIATSVGDKTKGMKGAIAATLGCVLPSFLMILCIAIFLTPDLIKIAIERETPDLIKNNHVISSIFMGIRPAVVAMIIAPVITSGKAAGITWKTVWIPIVVAGMISLDMGFISNPVLYIILGGLTGYLIFRLSRKRGNREESHQRQDNSAR